LAVILGCQYTSRENAIGAQPLTADPSEHTQLILEAGGHVTDILIRGSIADRKAHDY
jgi:hypothetical protein